MIQQVFKDSELGVDKESTDDGYRPREETRVPLSGM